MVDRTSRRNLLKAVASLPVAGFVLAPKAFGQQCSTAGSAGEKAKKAPAAIFHEEDVKTVWTCLPFVVKADKDSEAVASGIDQRGFLISLPAGEVVAYSRICEKLGCKFEFVKEARDLNIAMETQPSGAVLVCHCHNSVFDLGNDGKVVAGPERDPLHRFPIKRCEDKICILARSELIKLIGG